jgi:heme oxygenase
LDQLRAATSHCHRRLEKRLNIAQRFSSRATYRVYLEVMFGFYAPLEQSLSDNPVRGILTDYDERRKASLLTSDLLALGVAPDCIATLPQCSKIPFCQDEAAAFGSLYVLEGATLGGRVLLPMVEQRLQLTAHWGASYLASYGPNVADMWQQFGVVVEGWCADSGRRASAASAAVATFDSLEDWLCGDPA